ncbi:unnamed protein product [Orchesella dallaii]|uniref:N-acetyltransferase domain-containing protein n=1 Tax=Orchesella dallaii TaxID=48710 RepID=A0ABP1RS59_9HEXA
MTEHVEGEWKNFVFRMAKPSDYPSILEHLWTNFFPDEPLGRHIGQEETMRQDFYANVSAALPENLSFIAVDKANGMIAGVRITVINRKGEHEELPPNTHRKSLAIRNILMKLSEDAKVFERFPEIEHYADFFMVSVGRDYRGYGLASEIYDRTYKMLQAMKVPLIKCVFTSPYTQRIARKTGFEEVARMKISDWKYEDNGELCAPNAGEDEVAIAMIKNM